MEAIARRIAPAVVLSIAVSIAASTLVWSFLGAAPALAADMKYPDWEGQWRNPAAGQNGGPWDPTKPMGLGQQAPLTPEYQRVFEASIAAQAVGGHGNDRSGSRARA